MNLIYDFQHIPLVDQIVIAFATVVQLGCLILMGVVGYEQYIKRY